MSAGGPRLGRGCTGHGLHAIVTFLAVVCLLGSPSQASDVTVDAIFGWGGHTPGDRWAPVTVYIHSPERSISGTMLIEYAQDRYQSARIAAPFAAAAGTTTAIQSVVCLPQHCEEVKITLLNERGRSISSARFSNSRHATGGFLGTVRAHADGLLVVVGVPRLAEAIPTFGGVQGDFRRAPPPPPLAERLSSLAAVNVRPEDLPLSPMAYDGAMALVVRGDAAMEVNRAALDAVHQWVLSGGRLVIVAAAPGEQWRAWLPQEASGFVQLDRPTFGAVPDAIREVVREAIRGEPAEGGEGNTHNAADLMPRRLVRVTAAGRDEGWMTDLVLDVEGEEGELATSALVAHGPAGFGFVTVLGFDPNRLTVVRADGGAGEDTIPSYAVAAVWRRCLERMTGGFLASTNTPTDGQRYWQSSRAQHAINICLETLASVPVLGYTVFILIAGSVVLLALLVGPLDYLVLRRMQALQRSWLTSLLWIAVASAVAIVAPRVVRTDPTQVNRLSVIDQLGSADVDGLESARSGRPGLAFATGLTGIYAGHAGVAELTDVDHLSWWRGAVAIRYYFGGPSGGAALVPTVQRAVAGPSGSGRGNALWALPISQWTFRTFLDQSAKGLAGEGLRVRLVGDEDGGEVRVSGLPEGASVVSAVLRFAEWHYTLSQAEEVSAGEWVGSFAEAAMRLEPLPTEWRFESSTSRHLRWGYGLDDSEHLKLGAALALPGPDLRAIAIESRLASGVWAVLYLSIENCPPYPTLNWETSSSHTAVVRVLIPLPRPNRDEQ